MSFVINRIFSMDGLNKSTKALQKDIPPEIAFKELM